MMELSWPPELRFYEERTQIVRALEEAGLLTAFLMEDQRLGARLGPFLKMDVGPRSAYAEATSPSSGMGTAEEALRIAFDLLNPPQASLTGAQVQVVIPVEGPYDDARRRFTRHLTAKWADDALGYDCAVLLDGFSPSLQASFQVEFGVVNADELPERLSLRVGRISPLMPDRAYERVEVDYAGLPPCALYFGWTWHPRLPLASADRVGQAFEGLAGLREQSLRLSAGVQERAGLAEDTMMIVEVQE